MTEVNALTQSPVVYLMGPTGAGKTAAALALATRFPLEVISVDSALVYRGLDIGSAKPNPALRQRVAHHLIDIRDPAETYSAAQFRSDALNCIAAIRARGRIPLLVGGTGLYFRMLERGIAALPDADPEVRRLLAAELAERGATAMHARLAAIDPLAAARIHPNDPQRLLRALEVHTLTGEPISRRWQSAGLSPLGSAPLKLVLAPAERSELHHAIAQRFHAMLERGFINEVRRLRERDDLSLDNPALRTVGYRAIWRYLDGAYGYAEMIERGIVATRQLAKRQFTWFRRETDCEWYDSSSRGCIDALVRRLSRMSDFKRPAI